MKKNINKINYLADNFLKMAQIALSENSPYLYDIESLLFSREPAIAKILKAIEYVRSHDKTLKNIADIKKNERISEEEKEQFVNNKIKHFVNDIKNTVLTEDDLTQIEFSLNQKPNEWEYKLVKDIISNYLDNRPDNMNTISILDIKNI